MSKRTAKPVPVFNRRALQLGDHVHVRGNSKVGRFLRWGMNKWAKRVCEKLDAPAVEVWGNHDGIITAHPTTGELGVGEALLKGSVFTPLTDYEKRMASGRVEVRVYRVLGLSCAMRRAAANNWWAYMKGVKYNFSAYPRLAFKAMMMDWESAKYGWMRKIGTKAAGDEWDSWCTESNGQCYTNRPPGEDVFQTNNPTPMTTEQIAGEIPMREDKVVTIQNVSDMAIQYLA